MSKNASRPIKFRLWDKKEKMYLSLFENTRFYICPVSGLVFDTKWAEFRDCDVEQFTGFHDNEGREIYEGDVLNITYSTGHERDSSYDIQGDFQVKLHNGEWNAIGRNLWSGEKESEYSVWLETCDYAIKRGTRCVVVGNVHENPDFLK
jgi:uncharacterized phage protein (TIGR01671 family)